ncbi:MAG: GyrI-like domain-containing protein [Acidimicrobiales bacterium]|jgi:effector-binding domain-containing protein|nr:GyrI-like domain-containing protein [Acidimicrobiales bacterium]
MDEPEILELDAQHTAVVRAALPVAELPTLFDRAYGAVFAALAAQGVAPVGMPFGFYPSMPGEVVEVEAGVVVACEIEPAGEVVPGWLPGGRVVRAVHVGPFEALQDTYAAVMAWMADHGLEPAVGMWEVYVTDPSVEPDPGRWRTEVYCPVA